MTKYCGVTTFGFRVCCYEDSTIALGSYVLHTVHDGFTRFHSCLFFIQQWSFLKESIFAESVLKKKHTAITYHRLHALLELTLWWLVLSSLYYLFLWSSFRQNMFTCLLSSLTWLLWSELKRNLILERLDNVLRQALIQYCAWCCSLLSTWKGGVFPPTGMSLDYGFIF